MEKVTTHSYEGMVQDISNSKFSNNYYFEGRNIRIISTDSQSTGSITNEKGNKFLLEIPSISIDPLNKEISYNNNILKYSNTEIDLINTSGDNLILGHCFTRDYIILMTTNSLGCDCIWSLDSNNNLNLLYLRNLNLSIDFPIHIINNYENKLIDKIYWCDGNNQIGLININHSILNGDLEELIDLPVNSVKMVGNYSFSQPKIKNILSGGTHTSGMIQYAYNLYRTNYSQTKLSPLSELIPLDKGQGKGGGSVNEIVGSIPIVSIENIDKNYTNIKIYAIKYTSYNEIPSIFVIKDSEIPSTGNIEIFDDGSYINTLSLENFLFLGSDIIIPKHFNSKDNRLFFANYKEKNFKVDLDLRAYSFSNLGISKVYSNIYLNNANAVDGDLRVVNFNFTDDSEDKFDSINLDYDIYKYQLNGVIFGGEGKYLKYELSQNQNFNEDNKYFKDSEIYRLGIQFYNKYGQISLPYWISDFKSREGNLEGKFNDLKFELKPEFYSWLNNNTFDEYNKPVGYKLLIAERGLNDKTIVANGLLSSMMFNIKSAQETFTLNEIRDNGKNLPKLPNLLLRNCNFNSVYGNTRPLKRCENLSSMAGSFGYDTEVQVPYYGDKDASGKFYQFNTMFQLYSPEVLFNNPLKLSKGLNLRIKGGLLNKYNSVWSKETNVDTTSPIESKSYNGLSPYFSSSNKQISGSAYSNLDNGLLAHPGGSDPNRVEYNLWYRGYGDVDITDNYNSVKLINIPNSLTILTGTDPNPLDLFIEKDFYNNIIRTKQSVEHKDVDISYNININPLYSSVQYNAKICADMQGQFVYSETGLVTGNSSVSYFDSFIPLVGLTDRKRDFYLIIESQLNISGDVDVNVLLSNGTNPDLEKESLSNTFTISAINQSNQYFQKSLSNTAFEIYGSPEFTEKGQDFKSYNNDSNYKYSNSLTSCLTDGNSEYSDDGFYGRRIVSVNSENNRCITIVSGPDNSSIDHWNRTPLELMFSQAGLSGNDYGLIGELIKSREEIYLGNIYGGNSFEEKRRTNYIEIGEYNDISSNSIRIESPGDTFVNYFKFLRIIRGDQNILDQGYKQYEEMVEFFTETTVDLKNRSDLSLQDWDNKLYYTDSEFHKYNQVYSQLPDLIKRRNIEYNFKQNSDFDVNIISSKLKSPGEIIDNWTDILQNEVLSLDGRYGAINALQEFNDEIYCFQDNAFSFISINPRIQIQANDGLPLELGTGSILSDYKYISETGSLNKWGIVSSTSSLYFYDAIKNTFNVFRGNVEGLSDLKQMHTFFINNVDYNLISQNNPLIGKGICAGYDYINNDVLMTFLQNEKSFTISFSEVKNNYISFYDYKPNMYISYGSDYFVVKNDNKSIYEQFKGNYNEFFDEKFDSYIILNVNPEPHQECVFNNINFKSEAYINNIDNPSVTINKIRAYNEYQDSGEVPLIYSRTGNLRRKFRDWNALIPRQSRNRIRNSWIKLKLSFQNDNNVKLILHDLNIYYTV